MSAITEKDSGVSEFKNHSNKKVIRIALAGNPNSGKTTLFNVLTGLNQKIGNFPGVTVDKKTGKCLLKRGLEAEIIDLPGTYSLHPKSVDEIITQEVICDPQNSSYPDVTVIVTDTSNLKRNLFLASQVIDLKKPCLLVLNMIDLAEEQKTTINISLLSTKLGIPVIPMNARENQGFAELKQALSEKINAPTGSIIDIHPIAPDVIEEIKKIARVNNDYEAFQIANNYKNIPSVYNNQAIKDILPAILKKHGFNPEKVQTEETILRYKALSEIIEQCVKHAAEAQKESFTTQLDKILTHKVGGIVIFLAILFLIFQSIFTFSAYPMDFIEWSFREFSTWISAMLPPGILSSLITNGIIAGLSGVVVFIPQIAFLFAFIAILEDTGYMARVSFMMDKLMRKFGLNGKSVIPLISGAACAVPAIMSARTIGNWKERMITIMVTPLMSCSARIPVYTLLISLVVPSENVLGIFNYQGIVLMALYLIGFIAAISSALLFKFFLKARERSYFIMEMPVYRAPRWGSVGLTILEKVKVFLLEAGKVIIAISIILWVLSSFAPGDALENVENKYRSEEMLKNNTEEMRTAKIASEKLEVSYAGKLGKIIEPAIAPLGFDWKIGISLITSFAAREVFVGTMATIYSVGDPNNTSSIREKMSNEINPKTGKKIYTKATGFSLMIFFAFALQCMSTIAVVYRETKHWKWPFIQFVYMGVLAYLSSLIVYYVMK